MPKAFLLSPLSSLLFSVSVIFCYPLTRCGHSARAQSFAISSLVMVIQHEHGPLPSLHLLPSFGVSTIHCYPLAHRGYSAQAQSFTIPSFIAVIQCEHNPLPSPCSSWSFSTSTILCHPLPVGGTSAPHRGEPCPSQLSKPSSFLYGEPLLVTMVNLIPLSSWSPAPFLYRGPLLLQPTPLLLSLCIKEAMMEVLDFSLGVSHVFLSDPGVFFSWKADPFHKILKYSSLVLE